MQLWSEVMLSAFSYVQNNISLLTHLSSSDDWTRFTTSKYFLTATVVGEQCAGFVLPIFPAVYCLLFGPLRRIRPHNTTQQACATWHVSCRPSCLKDLKKSWKTYLKICPFSFLKKKNHCTSLYSYLSHRNGSLCTSIATKSWQCGSEGQPLLDMSYGKKWHLHWVMISALLTSKLCRCWKWQRSRPSEPYIIFGFLKGKRHLEIQWRSDTFLFECERGFMHAIWKRCQFEECVTPFPMTWCEAEISMVQSFGSVYQQRTLYNHGFDIQSYYLLPVCLFTCWGSQAGVFCCFFSRFLRSYP